MVAVRQNGANSSVVCTILETATTCSDTSHTVTFAVGDLISVGVAPSVSNPNARAMHWTAQFSPP